MPRVSPRDVEEKIEKECRKFGDDSAIFTPIFKAIVYQENSVDVRSDKDTVTYKATGDSGKAHGITQVWRIAVEEALGIPRGTGTREWEKAKDDPMYSIELGVKYLHALYTKNYFRAYPKNTRIVLSVAAYNGGPSIANNYNGDKGTATWAMVRSSLNSQAREYAESVIGNSKNYGGKDLSLGMTLSPDTSSGLLDAFGRPSKKSIVPSPRVIEPKYMGSRDDPPVSDTYPELDTADFFKIGDVILRVPPQNISLQESNAINTIDTVRTKGSPKVHSGNAYTSLSVNIIFPSIDDINGYWDDGIYYAGLRGLIAQYYRTPFVTIENKMIRDLLMPPGFYGQSRISEEPELDTLYDANREIEEYASSNGIDTKSSVFRDMILRNENNIKSIKEKYEEDLSIRRKLMESMNVDPMAIPNKYRERQLVVYLDSISISTMPGYPHSLNCILSLRYFNYDPLCNNFEYLRTDDDAMEQAASYSALRSDGSIEPVRHTPTTSPSESIPFKKYYRAILSEWQHGSYIVNGERVYSITDERKLLEPYNADPESPITMTYYFTTETRASVLELMVNNGRNLLSTTGMFVDRIAAVRSGESRGPKYLHEKIWGQIKAFYLFNKSTITTFGAILSSKLGGKVDTKIFDKEEMRYIDIETFLEKYNVSDNQLREAYGEFLDQMVTGNITPVMRTTIDLNTDDTVVTGISASYANNATPISLLGHREPMFQHMGGSDVNFQITLQTTSFELITELRKMSLLTSYTQMINRGRMYDMRDYIDTSASVEGEFFRMLGVWKVSVQDVSYSTTPDHPGLYSVTITCVQSDFDLTKYEMLVANRVVTQEMVKKVMEYLRTTRATGKSPEWRAGSVWDSLGDRVYRMFGGNTLANYDTSLVKKSEELWNAARASTKEQAIALLIGTITGATVGGGATFLIPGVREGVAIGSGVAAAVTTLKAMNAKDNASLRDMVKDLLEYYELFSNVRSELERPSSVSDLRNSEIDKMYEDAERKTEATRLRTTSYPDMNLPTDFGAMLAPPDFYLHRDTLYSVETINREAKMVEEASLMKAQQMLRIALWDCKDRYNAIFGTSSNMNDRVNELLTRYGAGKLRTVYVGDDSARLQKVEDGSIISISGNTITGERVTNMPFVNNIWNSILMSESGGSTSLWDKLLALLEDNNTGNYQERVTKSREIYNKILNEIGSIDNATATTHTTELALSAMAALNGEIGKKRVEELESKISKLEILSISDGKGSKLSDTKLKEEIEAQKEYLGRLKREYFNKYTQNVAPNGLTVDSNLLRANTSQYGVMSVAGEANRRMIQALSLDARRSDTTLHMCRAFPTFKLYFIEEDAEKWLMFDDFYSYSAVKSIDIVKSRKSASDIAVVRVSNITNVLNDTIADYMRESILDSDTVSEEKLDRIMLRVGCPVLIKMGYCNDPQELDVVFYGKITRVQVGNGELELECQGWGAQLHEPLPITGKGESIGAWDLRKNHGDIITWALSSVGMKHLGDMSIFNKATDIIRTDLKHEVTTGLVKYLTGLSGGMNNTRDDNIYLPYDRSWNPLGNWTFDWRIDGGATVWELIQEVLLWYPGWIATILPYYTRTDTDLGFRSTLYIGPRDGFYKYTDEYEDDWNTYMQNVVKNRLDIALDGGEAITDNPTLQGVTIDKIAQGMNSNINGKIHEWVDKYRRFDLMGVRRLSNSGIYFENLLSLDESMERIGNNINYVPNTNTIRPIGDISGDMNCVEYCGIVTNIAQYYGYADIYVMVLVKGNGDSHLIPIVGSPNCIYRGDNLVMMYSPTDTNRAKNLKEDEKLGKGYAAYRPGSKHPDYLRELDNDSLNRLSKGYVYYEVRRWGDLGTAIMKAKKITRTDIDIKFPRGEDKGIKITNPADVDNFFDKDGHLLRCFRPVSRHHFIDSYHNIMENNITASVEYMSNKVIMTYPDSNSVWYKPWTKINEGEPVFSWEKNKFNGYYEIMADDNISEDHVKAYYTLQKNIDGNLWTNAWEPYLFGSSKHDHSNDTVPPIPTYIKVANNILNNQIMEMYHGSITIVGDASINPWDTLYIYDFENAMSGPVQVEEVRHHFSTDTGFITTIVPDLVTKCNDLGSAFNTSYIHSLTPIYILKGLGSMLTGTGLGVMETGKVLPWLYKGSMAKWGTTAIGGGIKTGVGMIPKTAMKAIPIAGTILALGWMGHDFLRGMGLTIQGDIGKMLGRQPITITPLMYQGSPMVAGLEGMRWDDMWVHTVEKTTRYRDVPAMWIAGSFRGE